MCSLYSVVELKYILLHSLQHKRGCLQGNFPIFCPSLTIFQRFSADFGQGSSVSKFTKIHSVGAGRTEGRTQTKNASRLFSLFMGTRCDLSDSKDSTLPLQRSTGQENNWFSW
jgi:hypothetical protein